ncbi:MAG: HPr family phosphocarrier protein [Rhodanobacteraceae bacterium]|nr:HPr family phosphocarrier protein [Rhodanobacteraceae bacterium]MBP9154491.1 HPr family phosphocarrier protein [Xanthomonadales bacterium]HQW80599.1 HPr family phosphocarrier protein [Pseudomonadota bacterium]
MLEQEIIISNKLGLHARASAKLVQLVSGYRSTVMLGCRGREINAKSIMGLMLLAAAIGTPVKLRIDGEDEVAAMTAVTDLFNRKFDEGE